jgi:hypothetical protein
VWKGDDVVVLWADQQQGGGVFRPFYPDTGERLTFEATRSGGIVDATTATRWSIAGEGLSGALQGRRLEPIASAYVAFWGAWAAFHPDTRLWEGGGS